MKINQILLGGLLLFCIFSAGCIVDDSPKVADIAKIEIIIEGINEVVAVTGESDIQHICENLQSLELVKMEYTEPTILDYTLKFYDEDGELVESLMISVQDWISYDGYFHYISNGEFDRKFIAELVDIALSTGPEK